MANEATIINQPDGVPGAVSTGYTRQNTIAEATHNGVDHTAPYGSDTGEVTLPVGGPVDVNGVLYSIASAATLSGIAADTDYYIYLDGTGDTLTPTLTTDAGTFDASKNARYTAGGKRILNWVLRGDGVANVVCTRMVDGQQETPGFPWDAEIGNDLAVSGAVLIAETLGVTTDLTVGGDADVNGALSVDGAIKGDLQSRGIQSIAASGSYSLARGFWVIYLSSSDIAVEADTGTSYLRIATRISGTTEEQAGIGLFSDGTNFRVKSASGSTEYFRYWRF